jgi:hypothetical protein
VIELKHQKKYLRDKPYFSDSIEDHKPQTQKFGNSDDQFGGFAEICLVKE